jgi:arginine-glutamic acid dipeptide repeat-containing protein
MDPMLHYQLNSMYGPTARERWVSVSEDISHVLGRSQRVLSKNKICLMFENHICRCRLELEHLEREKREREMREMRERELSDRLKDELMKNAAGAGPRMPNAIDPHWLELHRRYTTCQAVGVLFCVNCNMAATTRCVCCRYTGLGPGGPPQGAALHQFGLYPTPTGPSQVALSQLERERLERLGEQSRCICLLK